MSKIIIPSDDDVHMADDDELPLCRHHRYAPVKVWHVYPDYVDARIEIKLTDKVFRVTCPNCLTILKERLYPEKRSNPDVDA